MFLDFSSIPEVAVSHFKGGQGQALVRRFEDEQGKILILTLPAGSTRSMTPMAQPPVIYPAPPVVPPQPAWTHPQPAGDRADDRTSDPRADPDDDR